jgi:hypothetical protein
VHRFPFKFAHHFDGRNPPCLLGQWLDFQAHAQMALARHFAIGKRARGTIKPISDECHALPCLERPSRGK